MTARTRTPFRPPSGQRAQARGRGARFGVAALVLVTLLLNVVPSARDVVSSFVGRAVTGVVGALTNRDAEVERLTRENIAANERARTAQQRLTAANESSDLTRKFAGEGRSVVLGRAIAFTPTPSTGGARKVELDIGSRDGIALSQPVVAARGLVGRLTRVGSDSSTVTLLGDPSSVVGARVERTRALARLGAGASTGTGTDVGLVVIEGGTVAVGDTVVTAGSPHEFPFPPGIPLGRVNHVDADRGQSERTASVTPFAQPGALDVVGVLVPGKH